MNDSIKKNKGNVASQTGKEATTGNGMNPQAPGKARIYNLIIVDESGSMWGLENVTIGGINETISTIKKAQQDFGDKQEHFLTLVTFDSNSDTAPVRTLIDAKPISEVDKFTDYAPNGGTPLYDAVGMSLTELHKRIKDDDNATAVVTIITDGEENCSTEWTAEALRHLIEQLTEDGWTFSYMGSTHDVKSVTVKLSINNVIEFSHDATGAHNTWHRDRSSKHALYQKMARNFDANESRELKRAHMRENARNYYGNRITPEVVDRLADGEVFVFGSNVDGSHTGGAAAAAVRRFGAVTGQAEGPQGHCYAIPTTGTYQSMAAAVDRFIEYAAQHSDQRFLVTRIGCGHACYKAHEVARLFSRAIVLENVCLPEDFWTTLGLKMNL